MGQSPVPGNIFFNWDQGRPVPDDNGFAGSFAGVGNGALIVAGGSNFPGGKRPWAQGVKTYYDRIFALEKPDGAWKEVGRLPRPIGYGVSFSGKDGLICVGGGDTAHVYAEAFILKYENGSIRIEKLPSLPGPLMNACGAVVHDKLFIYGGIASLTGETQNGFYCLDLTTHRWELLPSPPASSRMLAAAGSSDGKFYIFGGVHLKEGHREYLKDAWSYTPANKGWSKLGDMPHAVAAAPSPAYAAGQSHLVLFGGDDGALADSVQTLRDAHPGFPKDILSFNTITGSWSSLGKMPVEHAPVTTPLVPWNDKIVIAGGEARPGVRTNKVLMASTHPPSGKFGGLDWTVIALYFLAVATISVIVSRNMSATTGDFFLGGQKIPWWAAGLSIFGSKLSALTFIAIPAKAYATDWVYLMNNLMIVAVAPIVTIFYLPYFRKLKLTSVYEYLQIRFDARVKFIGSLTFVIFQLSRLGVVIYLPALVLSTVTGIDIYSCILLTTLITTAYSVAGGIEAVVWTEVMQVFVLLGGALASFFFITAHTEGGIGGLWNEALQHDKLKMANLGWSMSQPVLWVVVIGALLTNLVTYTSDQVVVQRYLTTATEGEARRSIYTNALMVIPATIIFFSVGTALWYFYRHHPESLNPNGRTDDVFPWFISQQLPAGLSGLVIAGLFAATMSTISSSMNSIATVITTDFYRPLRKTASDRQCLRFARMLTVVLGLLGACIAIYLVQLHNASIWDQYLKIIGLFGGCLAGMFAAGIFFPKINSTGILIGFLLSSVGLYFVQRSEAVNFFLYPVFAVLGCLLLGWLFSMMGPRGGKAAVTAIVLALATNGIHAQDSLRYIYRNGEDGYQCFRIPAMITTKSGTVLAFAEGRKNNCGDAGDIDLVCKRSSDGGKTWGPLEVVWNDSANTCGNPAPVVDQKTGRIILLSTWNLGGDHEKDIIGGSSKDSRRVYVLNSADEGRSWSRPVEITPTVKRENWTWYATGPGRGIQLEEGRKKGRIVIPCNHVEARTKMNNSHVIYSDDGGTSWRLGGIAPDSTNESTIAEMAGGNLMLNMRNTGKPRIRQVAISRNAGRSWSRHYADSTLIEPVCEGNLIRYRFQGQKDCLVFSNPASTGARIGLTVRLSYDNGKTWPVSKRLYEGPSAYSCLTILPDGDLGCCYEAGIKRPYEGIIFEKIPINL